jgi:hypothetical protein
MVIHLAAQDSVQPPQAPCSVASGPWALWLLGCAGALYRNVAGVCDVRSCRAPESIYKSCVPGLLSVDPRDAWRYALISLDDQGGGSPQRFSGI